MAIPRAVLPRSPRPGIILDRPRQMFHILWRGGAETGKVSLGKVAADDR
jgi:hypothetical protein